MSDKWKAALEGVDAACPKCSASDFDIVEKLIPHSDGRAQRCVGLFRCTACRAVLGVLDMEIEARVTALEGATAKEQ